MSLAAHDNEVGPLLGSSLLQLGRRITGTNPEPPWDVERVQRLGGPLARQLFDRAKRLLRVARHGHRGRRQRHRRHMADVHGRELGTEVGGEPSCHLGGLDAPVGAIDTENDSLHRCTSPSSRQPPGWWRPAHLMAASSTTRQPLLPQLRSEPAARDRQAPACRTDRPDSWRSVQLLPAAGVAAVMAWWRVLQARVVQLGHPAGAATAGRQPSRTPRQSRPAGIVVACWVSGGAALHRPLGLPQPAQLRGQRPGAVLQVLQVGVAVERPAVDAAGPTAPVAGLRGAGTGVIRLRPAGASVGLVDPRSGGDADLPGPTSRAAGLQVSRPLAWLLGSDQPAKQAGTASRSRIAYPRYAPAVGSGGTVWVRPAARGRGGWLVLDHGFSARRSGLRRDAPYACTLLWGGGLATRPRSAPPAAPPAGRCSPVRGP